MSDYTPTTEEIRDSMDHLPHGGEEFDRWLAAHDAAVDATQLDVTASWLQSMRVTHERDTMTVDAVLVDLIAGLRDRAAAIRSTAEETPSP